MNRTGRCLFVGILWFACGLAAQDPVAPPAEPRKPDPIEGLVAQMRTAEAAARSIRMQLRTEGLLPTGLSFKTSGSVRVLRGTQPGRAGAAMHTKVTYEFGDGLQGLVESSQTPNGIEIFEDNPAFGEVYVHVPQTVVEDLEWAGEVLQRSDLSGMADSRAQAPLGSGMVEDLRRQFDLQAQEGSRGKDAGVWLRGGRRAKVADLDPELPLADRVELFVRDRDRALLEVVHRQGDTVVQHIVVESLEVDVALEPKDLRVDGRGQRLREVETHLPLWEQIQDVLQKAEAKGGDEARRPSKRK